MKEENLQSESVKNENIGGINMLIAREPIFKDPLEDCHTAALPIAGCAWIDTKDGVVLIDTLLYPKAAEKVMERIKGKIQYIIYTHGHYDHVGVPLLDTFRTFCISNDNKKVYQKLEEIINIC